MPELPEVDAFVNFLRSELDTEDWTFDSVDVRRGKRYLPGTQKNSIVGKILHRIRRRGKIMVFEFKDSFMTCHNAMSGYWDFENKPWTFDYVEGKRTSTEKDVRVSFGITSKSKIKRTLRFHDARLFGRLDFEDKKIEADHFVDMGPDVVLTRNSFDSLKHMSYERFYEACQKHKKTIKELLLDQRIIAGVGNIYASEICFRAGVHPYTESKKLDHESPKTILNCCHLVMMNAIDHKLKYDEYLKIYRRKNCGWCGSMVECTKIAGRSSYFCPSCQKA